jgi:hypothetical protein
MNYAVSYDLPIKISKIEGWRAELMATPRRMKRTFPHRKEGPRIAYRRPRY